MGRSRDKLRAVRLLLATTTNGDYLMLMRVKYLQRHGGRLRYRRRIPEHLREIVNKGSFWTQALDLNAGEEMKAVPRVSAANRKYEMEMRLAEKELALLNDPARKDIEAERQAVEAEQWAREMRFIGYDQSGMLSDPGQDSDYGIWLETVLWAAESRLRFTRPVELEDLDPLDRLKIETVKAGGRIKQPVTLARAMKLHADERQGGTPGKAEVQALRRLKKWLSATEANPRYTAEGSLHLSEFSRADAMRFSREMWTVDGSSHATIKRTIGVFKAVWTLANDHFEVENAKNPWSALKPPKGCPVTSDKEKRLPFTAEHWRGIRHGLQVNSVDPEIKIAIRVLTCTGARPLEIGGLMADEVHNDHDGVWIDIRVNEIRGTKTIGSPRRLPIVDPVLAADLWALAEKRKGRPLFQKGFHTTSNLSGRLNKFLRNKCGIPKSPRTVVYSFRHSMRQALRVAEVPDYIANYIYAHAGNKISDGYGASNVELFRLKEAIEKALPRLGEVDLRDYAEHERGLTIHVAKEMKTP